MGSDSCLSFITIHTVQCCITQYRAKCKGLLCGGVIVDNEGTITVRLSLPSVIGLTLSPYWLDTVSITSLWTLAQGIAVYCTNEKTATTQTHYSEMIQEYLRTFLGTMSYNSAFKHSYLQERQWQHFWKNYLYNILNCQEASFLFFLFVVPLVFNLLCIVFLGLSIYSVFVKLKTGNKVFTRLNTGLN